MATQLGIKLGTVIANAASAEDMLAKIGRRAAQGFESVEIAFKNTLGGLDLASVAAPVAEIGCPVSCLGIYGNTLAENTHGEEIRSTLRQMIALAPRFGTDLVCCFTGRVTGMPVPESIPRFREVFGELAKEAEQNGVRLAFENCTQGGNWQHGDRNIAFCEEAWERMFDAVPADNLGLEWEPAHHLCQLVAPLPQLRAWASRVFHLHGKDAEVHPEILAKYGTGGEKRFAHHRFPGLGDTNWAQLISELVKQGFSGSIDVEGGHDPVYRGDLEDAGQLLALRYLKTCLPP